MGVLNITPDSFSDGGQYLDPSIARDRANDLHKNGADLVDIGGESTGPGSTPISADQEWQRVAPVVEALAPDLPLSLDTYHAATARRGLEAGVACINDVSAGRADPGMIPCLAGSGALYVMTFAKDSPLPHASDQPRTYPDVTGHLAAFFQERIETCLKAGIAAEQLVVDPGLGRFVSADPEYSWRILEGIGRLIEAVAPVPLMIGASRKGFLGGKLAERDPISQHVALLMAAQGAQFIRTHDIVMARQFLAASRRLGLIPG